MTVQVLEDERPAFPTRHASGMSTPGMTLRDYFAGQTLLGLVQLHVQTPEGEEPPQPDDIARDAYAFADAMLRAREAAK